MLKAFCGQHAQKSMDTQMEMNKFYCCKGVLRNNYWSRNLIGLYHFWVISPRNLTLFTRPFLAGRHVWAGYEPKYPPHSQLIQCNLCLRQFAVYTSTLVDMQDPPFRFFEGLAPRLTFVSGSFYLVCVQWSWHERACGSQGWSSQSRHMRGRCAGRR